MNTLKDIFYFVIAILLLPIIGLVKLVKDIIEPDLRVPLFSITVEKYY